MSVIGRSPSIGWSHAKDPRGGTGVLARTAGRGTPVRAGRSDWESGGLLGRVDREPEEVVLNGVPRLCGVDLLDGVIPGLGALHTRREEPRLAVLWVVRHRLEVG